MASGAAAAAAAKQHTGKPNYASRSYSHQLQFEYTRYGGDPLDSLNASLDEDDLASVVQEEVDLDYHVRSGCCFCASLACLHPKLARNCSACCFVCG
jgi:hypothetical protein